MQRRNLLVGSLALSGLAVTAVAGLWPASDEERLMELVTSLAETVSFEDPITNVVFHGSELAGRFETLFSEQVEVVIPEAGVELPDRPKRLAMAAARVMARYGAMLVTLSDIEVVVDASGSMGTVRARADVELLLGSSWRRDTRQLRFAVARKDEWRINRLEVSSSV